ncbi:MAG: hypothetical protein WDN03_09935 [Rhizomicrobium sp.]
MSVLVAIQASWFFHSAWLPFHEWSRLFMPWAKVVLVSRWNGATVSALPPPRGWNHTGLPPGSAIARGSSKPRTPRSVPK